MATSRRQYLKIAGGTVLAAGVAGCTSNSNGGSGGGNDGSEENNNQKSITIGASIAQSGAYAKTAAYAQKGFKLWSDQLNANGGLLGRKIKWQFYDDKSDPQQAVQLYQKLINDDNVDLLFGPFGSPIGKATAPIQEQAGYATIQPMASDSAIWTDNNYEYVFQGIGISRNYIRDFIRMVGKQGAQSIAFANPDTAFPTAATKGAVKYAKQENIEVLDQITYTRGKGNYSQIAANLASQKPDVVAGGGYFPDATGLTRGFKSAGYNADAYAFYTAVASGDFYDTLGSVANGISGNTSWNPHADTHGNQSFTKSYRKKYKQKPDYHAAGTYAAGQVLQAVVEKIGEIDQDAIKNKLTSGNYKSVFGKWKTNNKNVQTGYGSLIIQWQNGNQEIIAPDNVATADPIYPAPTWGKK